MFDESIDLTMDEDDEDGISALNPAPQAMHRIAPQRLTWDLNKNNPKETVPSATSHETKSANLSSNSVLPPVLTSREAGRDAHVPMLAPKGVLNDLGPYLHGSLAPPIITLLSIPHDNIVTCSAAAAGGRDSGWGKASHISGRKSRRRSSRRKGGIVCSWRCLGIDFYARSPSSSGTERSLPSRRQLRVFGRR